MPEHVKIELTKEEAIVLFELLARLEDMDALPVEHPAEERVLWRVSAVLEKTLAEPFDPEYKAILERVRQTVAEAGIG
jgi:hypothetical protein